MAVACLKVFSDDIGCEIFQELDKITHGYFVALTTERTAFKSLSLVVIVIVS